MKLNTNIKNFLVHVGKKILENWFIFFLSTVAGITLVIAFVWKSLFFLNTAIQLNLLSLLAVMFLFFLLGRERAKPKKKLIKSELRKYDKDLLWMINLSESGEIIIDSYPYCPKCRIEFVRLSRINPAGYQYKCPNLNCNYMVEMQDYAVKNMREGLKNLIKAEKRGDFKS